MEKSRRVRHCAPVETNPFILQTIEDHLVAVTALREQTAVIGQLVGACTRAIEGGGKVCFFGNGGSAADAQHFAAELVVRYTRNRRPLAAIAFTTDTSILTAGANDFGYEGVFARQVEALCDARDVVVGISTSGTSANVVAGLKAAKAAGAFVVAFTGRQGGACADLADLAFCAPSDITARVQECHLLVGHILCDLVEAAFAA